MPIKKAPARAAATRRTAAREGNIPRINVEKARSNRNIYNQVQSYRARPTTTTTRGTVNPFDVVARALEPKK